MTDAIGEKNFDRAAGVLGELYQMQETPYVIMASLGRQMRQLYSARLALEQGKGASYVADLWKLKRYPADQADDKRQAVFPKVVPEGRGPLRSDRSGDEVHWTGRQGAADYPSVGTGRSGLRNGGREIHASYQRGHRGRGPV